MNKQKPSVATINDLARQHGYSPDVLMPGQQNYFTFTVRELHAFVAALFPIGQVAPQATVEPKPDAYLIPMLLTFKNAVRTSAPEALQAEVEGTVGWLASMFHDDESVTDKFGVTHNVRPLFATTLTSKATEPILICKTCDADRSRVPCPRANQNCGFVGTALSASKAGTSEAIRNAALEEAAKAINDYINNRPANIEARLIAGECGHVVRNLKSTKKTDTQSFLSEQRVKEIFGKYRTNHFSSDDSAQLFAREIQTEINLVNVEPTGEQL